MKEKIRYLIIGNCIAGITAASELRRLNPKDEIIILSDEPVPGYCRCLITYYLGNFIQENQLFSHSLDWYKQKDIELQLSTKVVGIDPKNRYVITNKRKKKIAYDKLLIASGARPLFFPGVSPHPDGILGMRTYEDAKRLIALADKGKRALIVGAGFVGLKTAYGLIHRGVKVDIVELLPNLMGRMIDAEASHRITERLTSHPLLDIRFNTSVIETVRINNRFRASLSDGTEMDVDFVVVSVGTRPNIEFLEDTGVKVEWAIVVDEKQMTTVEDIYAAGDNTVITNLLTGKKQNIALWPIAASQARVAAFNMSGRQMSFPGDIPMNSVDFFGLWYTALGEVQAEGDGIVHKIFSNDRFYQKLILKDDKPIGFLSVSNVNHAGIILSLIRERVPWKECKKHPLASLVPILQLD